MIKQLNTRKGLTLVEVIAAVVILTIVMAVIFNVLTVSLNSLPATEKAVSEQNAMRLVSETFTDRVQSAGHIVTVPQDAILTDCLKDGWNYIGVNDDGNKIVNYIYSEADDSYRELVLADIDKHHDYQFSVHRKATDDKVLEFAVKLIPKAAADGAEIALNASVRAENVTTIVEKGTTDFPAHGVVYCDKPPADKRVYTNIMLIVDASSSMLNDMMGNTATSTDEMRITKLQKALLGGVENGEAVEGFIDYLSRLDDIRLCFIPFNNTANYMNDNTADLHPYFDLNYEPDRSALKDKIANMNNIVKQGTNVGDALRRAYYCLYDLGINVLMTYLNDAKIVDCVIVIVDGCENLATFKHFPIAPNNVKGRMLLEDGLATPELVDFAPPGEEQLAGVNSEIYQNHSLNYVYWAGVNYGTFRHVNFYIIGIGDDENLPPEAVGFQTVDDFLVEMRRCVEAERVNHGAFDPPTYTAPTYRLREDDSFADVFAEIGVDIKQKIDEKSALDF